ncbi:MAG: hypothetical protein SFX72_01730 [Isosphaeraceae bacterium]|nr:hypothetical protein [Isosphaeraceae bacterium]
MSRFSADDLEAILAAQPCLAERVRGRDATVRSRREAIMIFFDKCVFYHADVDLSIERLLDDVATIAVGWSLALERAYRPDATALEAEIARDLLKMIVSFDEALAALRDASFDASVSGLRVALAEIFDWHDPRKLRAYLYVTTSEVVLEGLLGKERCLWKDAMEECLKEVK